MPAKKAPPRKAKDLKPKVARPSTAAKVRGGSYMADPGGVVSQPPPKKK